MLNLIRTYSNLLQHARPIQNYFIETGDERV